MQPHMLIPNDFDPAPSRHRSTEVRAVSAPGDVEAAGFAVTSDLDVPSELGLDRDALKALGFTGESGQTLVLPRADAPFLVAVGVGAAGKLDLAGLRTTAANLVRAAKSASRIATDLVDAAGHLDRDAAISAIVEGSLLGRYRYEVLKTEPKTTTLDVLELVTVAAEDKGSVADASGTQAGTETGSTGTPGIPAGTGGTASGTQTAAGTAASGTQSFDAAARRGLALAGATMLARDLASTPPAHLTATRFADLAAELGPQHGLEVTVHDKQQLIELECGGLLGVNAGSVEEPRMVRLEYRPEGEATGALALVGKGIMYDSGGLSLKPGDGMHATMKMDMSGAAAVLAAMLALRELGCRTAVTGYLMCTDNMPSGSAIALGEVLRIHGGKTVEVKNTDAEGRLVLSDGLSLAREQGVDAIVDIATLTGAAMRALGTWTAPVFGTDQGLVEQVLAASSATDESVWQLPLERRYREYLNSDVADLSNIGGPNAGATTAALFLAEFVGDTPWAHLDIAGTMQSDKDDAWRSKGATGFGARLLAELAVAFEAPKAS